MSTLKIFLSRLWGSDASSRFKLGAWTAAIGVCAAWGVYDYNKNKQILLSNEDVDAMRKNVNTKVLKEKPGSNV